MPVGRLVEPPKSLSLGCRSVGESKWPFWTRSVVEVEQKEWIVDHYDWLLNSMSELKSVRPVVLPSEEFFSRPPALGHQKALHIFEEVKLLMGMSEWPCRLQPQEDPSVGEVLYVANAPQDPLGTFSVEEISNDNVIITYNPKSLANPHSLIATFAHELSHYLLASCPEPRPYEGTDEECLTDLLAIVCGFGVFLANSSFNFQ